MEIIRDYLGEPQCNHEGDRITVRERAGDGRREQRSG